MRLKLMSVFLLIVAASLYAIYWKVDRDFFYEKLSWNETQTRSQLAAITQDVSAEIDGLTQILDLSLPILAQNPKDYNGDQGYSRFEMVSKIMDNGTEKRLAPAYFLEQSPVKAWGLSYAYQAVLALKKSDNSAAQLVTLLDPSRKPWFLLVTTSRVTQERYAAILKYDFLQAIVDRQKGQAATFSIVNTAAQVFAHSTPEYIGTTIGEDPLVQKMMSSDSVSGSGIFNGLQNEKNQGFFERVNGSNLFVVISTPIRVLTADRDHLKNRFIYLGLGISLLGACLILLLENPQVAAYAGQKSAVVEAAMAKPAPAKTAPAVAAVTAPKKAEAAVVKSAPPINEQINKQINEMKVPAPVVEKTGEGTQFDSLFGDKKLNEAFAMIDSLEPAPPPISEATVISTSSEGSDSDAPTKVADVGPIDVEISQAPPPPRMSAGPVHTEKPNIEINRKPKKSDDFMVVIRKPKIGKDAEGELS